MTRADRAVRRDIFDQHHVFVAADNEWQSRARLAQSLWRQREGLEAGLHHGRPLGSRLTERDGRPPSMANYLSATIRAAVQRALATRQPGALFSEPRLWVDLLSSQPLCFNLFGELAADLDLAGRVLQSWWGGRIETVESIRFEWSPGRGNLNYTGNKSAFDVFVSFRGPRGVGFLAIEVKYHEDLRDKGARVHQRYRDIARHHGSFPDATLSQLESPPLQQLWLDHLLALQTRRVDESYWQDGLFVVLYPGANQRCRETVARYQSLLRETDTFDALTLEDFVDTVNRETSEPWAAELHERYLAGESLRKVGWPLDQD